MKKKNMKKIAGVLALIIGAGTVFAGCGKSDKLADWDYIEDKGKLTIGITLYEPMNYYEDDKLTGFDTEFAEAVCEILGVEPDFQVIEWDSKETELKSKTIDCIWNGLTVSEDRKENMAFSKAYVNNEQVAIIQTANKDKYDSLEKMTDIAVAAENGSAGQTAIEENEYLSKCEFIAASAQKDVLLEVKAGTVQVGVIDSVMAIASIKEGTDYSDLMIVEGTDLTAEQYAVGLRLEDKELLEKVNAAIDELADNGKLYELAEKYGLEDVYAFEAK